MLIRSMMMLSFFLFITVVTSSCTCYKTSSRIPSQYEKQLEKRNRQLNTEVENLKRKLFSKQGEMKKLLLSQQPKTREVVRTKSKLRSHSSKAETVANIAEVKTVLRAVAEKAMNEELQQAISESKQVTAMSIEALKRGDVGKAFNLSNRAQELIQPIRTFQGMDVLTNGSDVVYISPLIMKALTTCNVRSGPGMNNKVHFKLEDGTHIKALTYNQNWIQIEDESQGKGWVYHQLLDFVQ